MGRRVWSTWSVFPPGRISNVPHQVSVRPDLQLTSVRMALQRDCMCEGTDSAVLVFPDTTSARLQPTITPITRQRWSIEGSEAPPGSWTRR